MLNAKQAKEQTESSKVLNCRADIEKAIKKAIQKGRDYIFCSAVIPAEIRQELSTNDYKIEDQNGRTKISW